jgi:integrase
MRADLIERAIMHNPALAASLQHARQGGALTTKALAILVQAADIPRPIPAPAQPLSQWFKPKTVAALQSERLHTLHDLMTLMQRRGTGWWRALPRIGKKRAAVIEAWLTQHAKTLGLLVLTNKSPALPAAVERIYVGTAQPIPFVPLSQLVIPAHLDGSTGINRDRQFCYIAAKTDRDAIEAFLSRYVDAPHTLRAFQKELQRLAYYALLIAKKPLSSFLVDDCIAYLAFLTQPHPDFVGPRAPLDSGRWKPFTATPLSLKSQRQAVTVCRQCFAYWVGVRYLAGNPWLAVKLPQPVKALHALRIEKALPAPLWQKLIDVLTELAALPASGQVRIALAAILLMGEAGCRRDEVAQAKYSQLQRSQFGQHLYELTIIGKGNKERIVPISSRTLRALQAHWADRGLLSETEETDFPVLAPLFAAPHAHAKKRYDDPNVGYTADGLYRLIKVTLKQVMVDPGASFDTEEQRQLYTTTAHAFRHTFGTLSIAAGMAVDVVQTFLGHASLHTTSIYVQAKKKRMMEQASAYFNASSDSVEPGASMTSVTAQPSPETT